MNDQIVGAIFGFVLLPLACVGLERLFPSIRGKRVLRGGFGADVVWYFAQTFVSRAVAPWFVYLAALPALIAAGVTAESYWQGFGPASRLPMAAQVAIVFVAADFFSYWQHRFFHLRLGWPVHAVHHSSREVDWLSATRFHPLNEIGAQVVYAAPLIACGLSPLAFVWLAPFTATYAVLLHANLRWSYGPLTYLIASPIYHRWHHTSAAEGQNRNFAGFLPVWDLLFGTFYLPPGRAPEHFGTDDPVPDGFLRQLAHPFTRAWVAPPHRQGGTR